MSAAQETQGGDAFLTTDTDKLAAFAQDIMDGRTDLAALAGMTEDEIEAVYTLGHGFYTGGSYQDAVDIFKFLCMHRHMDKRFWMGLGAASQLLKDYNTAITAYRTCAMLDLSDAQVPLRAAECFTAVDDREQAQQALEAVGAVAERFPNAQNAVYAARAKLILAQSLEAVS